jgi:hypothetical protein
MAESNKIMKKLIALVVFVFAGVIAGQAQQTNNEGYVGYQFLRQDVKFERPSIHFDENTDSHGVNAAYTYYFAGKKGKVNVLGITGEVGANFDNNEASLITAMGGLTLKARNSRYVQPYVHALGGVARQHVNRRNIFDTTDYSTAFAAGGGVDFNLKANSRYKVRFGADYLNTGFAGERQNAVRLSTGLVF